MLGMFSSSGQQARRGFIDQPMAGPGPMQSRPARQPGMFASQQRPAPGVFSGGMMTANTGRDPLATGGKEDMRPSQAPMAAAPFPEMPMPSMPTDDGGMTVRNFEMPQVPMFDEGEGLQGRMDYDNAQYAANRARRTEKRQKVVGTIAAGLAGFSAGMGNPAGMAVLQDMQQRRREMAETAARQQTAEQEAQRKLYEPRTVGSNLIQMQPDGSYAAVYNAPEPFEDYAASLGYQRGTDDYAEAVRNYRLGSWSDDAVEAKQGLTGYRYDRMGGLQDRRYDRMGDLQDERLDVTRRGQDLSSSDRRRGQDLTRRGQDVRSGDTQRGQDLTDRRTRESADFQGRGGRASAAGSAARAVNPRTGQAIVFKGGQWVDEKSGKPVT